MTEKEHINESSLELAEDLGGETAEILAEDKKIFSSKIAEEIRRIRKERTGTLYSDIIFTLTRLRFDEETAKEKWKAVLEHKYLISEKLGRNVGIRVAMMDYFQNITRELKHATMMDIMKYKETARELHTDWLTGTYQKGYFLSVAEEKIEELKKEKRPASILFFDLDHFKKFNDTNGHLVGDVLLKLLANYIGDLLKDEEIFARFGGEEFVVLFPYLRKNDALKKSENIRRTISDLPFPGQEVMPEKRITLSGGIASLYEDGNTINELLEAADKALYEAKKMGRNRITPAYPTD